MKSAFPSRVFNSTRLASIAGGVAVGVLGALLA